MDLRTHRSLLLFSSASLLSSTALADVSISEVMANTAAGFNDSDEYIELCNPDTSDVDVAGYVINDGDDIDELVAWTSWTDSEGASLASLGNESLVEDSTIIPAGGCALILDPDYTSEDGTQPYDIESGTVILTVASGTAIGGAPGLGATDALTLYGAGGTTAADVISTYGTPVASDDPGACDDDELDGIPLDPDDGRSSSRIDLAGADEEANWQDSAPSPGFRSSTGTFEVAADGSADYLTIGDAIRAAGAGSEILVHPGSYAEDVIFTEGITLASVDGATSTTIAGNISIDSVGGAPALVGFTIEGDVTIWSVDTDFADNALVGGLLTWHYANGSITGSSFTGGDTAIALDYYASPEISSNAFSGQTSRGVYCTIGSSPHILGNTFDSIEESAIYCSSDPTIESNDITSSYVGITVTGGALVFDNVISNGSTGIYGYDSEAEITANTLTGNTVGIWLADSAGTVLNNVLVDSGTGIGVEGGITDFIYNEVSATPDLLHNTVFGSSSAGVSVSSGTGTMVEKSEPTLIAGNLVTDGESGIEILVEGTELYNNNATRNTSDYLVELGADEELDASNISADPLYADWKNQDFSLQSGSPCIDAGWDGELSETDYDGSDRVVDGDGDEVAIADIGALEFSGYCADADADGYQEDCGQEEDVDCDDTDASVNPGAEEVWYDGVDQDCDGNDDDQDGDGYSQADDCNDTDADIFENCDEGSDIVDEESGKDETTGCGCASTPDSVDSLAWLAIVGLVGFARRRRDQA
jgi:MYXO-CTERM domain-containing protein